MLTHLLYSNARFNEISSSLHAWQKLISQYNSTSLQLSQKMEEVIARFSHLGEAIFKKLNNETVANTIEASRKVSLFVDCIPNQYNLASYLYFRRVDYHYPIDIFHNSFPSPLKLDRVNHYWFDHYFDKIRRQRILNFALQGDFHTTQTLVMNGLYFIAAKDGYGGPLFWQHLYWAVDNGYFHIVEYILNRTVEKNPANDKGDTPLHMAVKRERFDIFKYIVEKVENKNPANDKGDTPLHELHEYTVVEATT